MPARLDLSGMTFGRLTAVSREGKGKHGHTEWLCRCVCGGTIVTSILCLRNGSTSSCGCLRKENARRCGALSHGPIKHHGTVLHPSEYAIWKTMVQRATGKASSVVDRELYSVVTICDRWRTSFADFLADMGPKPFPGASLDRYPNKDGGYEPGNVRWATPQQQRDNQRPRRDAATVKARREEFRKGARP